MIQVMPSSVSLPEHTTNIQPGALIFSSQAHTLEQFARYGIENSYPPSLSPASIKIGKKNYSLVEVTNEYLWLVAGDDIARLAI